MKPNETKIVNHEFLLQDMQKRRTFCSKLNFQQKPAKNGQRRQELHTELEQSRAQSKAVVVVVVVVVRLVKGEKIRISALAHKFSQRAFATATGCRLQPQPERATVASCHKLPVASSQLYSVCSS